MEGRKGGMREGERGRWEGEFREEMGGRVRGMMEGGSWGKERREEVGRK